MCVDGYMKGMSFDDYSNQVPFGSPKSKQSLQNLKKDGTEWVSLILSWYVQDINSTTIGPQGEKVR